MAFLILFVLCGILSSCGTRDKQKGSIRIEKSKKYNIILITLDCLRPDHLSCYGYTRRTSPNIDAFAAGGVSFVQAITQAGWTLPSHSSLFTSQYVSRHMVDSQDKELSDSELTLAKILNLYGYKTAAFVNGILLNREFGLAQGFEVYRDDFDDDQAKKIFFERKNLPDAKLWLRLNRGNAFFLFLHINDIHAPYSLPAPYENIYDRGYKGVIDKLYLEYEIIKKIGIGRTFFDHRINFLFKFSPRDVEHVIAHYDAGITYTDKTLGDLFAYLRELGLWDNTIIIVIADHGEALGDNAKRFLTHAQEFDFGHDDIYFDEVLRVPFILRHPGITAVPRRIDTQVQLIDIMPTVLDFLGISPPKGAQGKSLVPLLEGRAVPDFNKYVFSEIRGGFSVVRSREWKLICGPHYCELYCLKKDPKERKDVAKRYPAIVKELSRVLEDWQTRNSNNPSYDTREQ